MKTSLSPGFPSAQVTAELESADAVSVEQPPQSATPEANVTELKRAATALDATPAKTGKTRWSPMSGGTRHPQLVSSTPTAVNAEGPPYEDFKKSLTDMIKAQLAAALQTTPDQIDLKK